MIGSTKRVVRETCRRGHPRTSENTYVHEASGRIQCRRCHAIWTNQNGKRPEVRKKCTTRLRQWRAAHRVWDQERTDRLSAEKRAFLKAWKAELGCLVCGKKDPRCLALHHRDLGTKEVNLSAAVRMWKQERILAELAKCDVLCENCHGKRHAEMRKLHAAARVA